MVEIENNMPDKVWSFKRIKGDNEVHCLFNFTDEDVVVAFDEAIAGKDFKELNNALATTDMKNVELKAWEYKLFYKN